MAGRRPLIVGIGGTTTQGSSTQTALAIAMRSVEDAGLATQVFDGAALAKFPHYGTGAADHHSAAEFLAAIRAADGLIVASPGYHGSISGLVKNALDYIEQTSRDARVYLDGLPVGLIVTAYGWQATGSTLAALRSIVHGLRGWPTPLGAAINTSGAVFADGACRDAGVIRQLETVAQQVVGFVKMAQACRSLERV